ncbi:MAG: hypothetical protein NVSMB62_09090 [Acidobacteriaceae bacterium]
MSFEIVGPEMASAVGGPPLMIRLLNSKGEPQRTFVVKAGEVIVGAHDKVVYSGFATAGQAAQLGAALTAAHFLHDQGSIVVLGRDSASAPPQVALFTVDGAWDNLQAMGELEAMVRAAAPTIGGLPVVVHVLDPKGQLRREITVQ